MAADSDPAYQPLLLELPSLTPSLAAEFLPHGLTLHRLFLQADGRTHDLVVGPEAPTGHSTQKYTNTLIGRYTNRVPVGSHTISKNGLSTTINPIANPAHTPTVSLHGGPKGFDQLVFEPVPLDAIVAGGEGGVKRDSPPGVLFSAEEIKSLQSAFPQGAGALWRAISEDGDQGYPGALLVEVAVGLVQPQGKPAEGTKEYDMGGVVMVYRAALLDEGEKVVTPVNLTQHWGFNLDASLKDGEVGVKGHNLKMDATHTAGVDALKLPKGENVSVEGTGHKHDGKKIGEGFPSEEGYDHFYVFSKREPRGAAGKHRFARSELASAGFDGVRDVLSPGAADGVVELASSKSGIKLVFGTNQSGVQFYSHNFSDPNGSMKRIHGGAGAPGPNQGYPPHSAVFLEFHEPLAAFLYPGANPSGDDTILAPGEVYNNYVRVDVRYASPTGL